MNLANLFNLEAALIVCGGTTVATALRCGRADLAATGIALAGIGRRHFDADQVRAELAGQLREIEKDGLMRAKPRHFSDPDFDEANGAMLSARSVSGLLTVHERHKARRQAVQMSAVRTLALASELAPVFGLAGTLISLSQLPADGLAKGAFAGAIALAVLTTLYGLLMANLVLAPLARLVARAAQREEAERQSVVDWLSDQVARAAPPKRPAATTVASRNFAAFDAGRDAA